MRALLCLEIGGLSIRKHYGFSYRIFIEGFLYAVTKEEHAFALQKYMNYLKEQNPENLLKISKITPNLSKIR